MEKLLLIVEDNAEMAGLIGEFLSDSVDRVIIANTVDQAQDCLETYSFSLITLDINLRGRNGSEVVKFIIDNPKNKNKNVPIIIISGMVSTQFIEKNKLRYAGIMGKPFQITELLEIAAKALSNHYVNIAELELGSFDKIPFLKCKVPITPAELDLKIASSLAMVKKLKTPKAIFNSLKVDRNPDNYFTAHTELLINVILGFAKHLQWDTEKTLTKLIYAASLHDIALSEKPHLAKIGSLENLEVLKMNQQISDIDYRLIFEHANMAATSIANFPKVDEDILTILRQHHELPDETGFPEKIIHKKFIPMSALFIIAHDFADYIIENQNWSLSNYLPLAKEKFSRLVFLRIIASLSTLK